MIRDLTAKEFAYRKALLAAGDMLTVRDVGDSVTDYLAFAYDDLHDLVLGKKTFEQIRDKVMENEAEVVAIQQVEAMEKRRAQSAQEQRIEQRVWDHFYLSGHA
jgi:muconolactone delta-isomerase